MGVLVLHAHDAHAVGAFVLDEQGEGVVEFEEELEVAQAHLDVVELHEELYQVVVVEYAELPHQDYMVHLGTGVVDHNLPLGGYLLLHDLVGRGRGHYLPVGETVVAGNCIVGRGQLLLAPVVAVGDEPIVPLLVGIGPGYFRHGGF